MFAKISHIDVNFSLALSHIFVHFFQKAIVALCKTRVIFSYLQLIRLKFSFDMKDKLLEVVLENQLVNHRLMNFDRWKFILSAFNDDSGELCKMFWKLL